MSYTDIHMDRTSIHIRKYMAKAIRKKAFVLVHCSRVQSVMAGSLVVMVAGT